MSAHHVYAAIINAEFCKVGIQTTDSGEIFEIRFLPPNTLEKAPTNLLAARAVEEISAYLITPHHHFSLPLAARGTDFQRRTWQAIATIPAGQVETYGVLAKNIGGNARAVGQACGSNPFPILIPCHRVVSQSGLGGFAHSNHDWLIATKRWLLTHEGAKGVQGLLV